MSSAQILDSDERALRRHVERRHRDGIDLNVNVVGEAVLGEDEARDRLGRVLEMMSRPDVHYVSVKASSVVSQLVTVDLDRSIDRVAARLRDLYRASKDTGVFVNLDMEEYRDLEVTLGAFTTVLDESEFEGLDAGVVLQAYLPESHAALNRLSSWSKDRHHHRGGAVKVRLVKGANLAMEHAEAVMHGWTAAPYATKADVDASYLRLIDVALRRESAPWLRVGVASHNLFDVAWAIEVARARDVRDALDIEMLEGMANAEAAALVRAGQSVLLYAPVTRRDDFSAAVAYLVRRLDENTAPENFLTATFAIATSASVFDEQRGRFETSVAARHHMDTRSLRHETSRRSTDAFFNEPSRDPTDPVFVAELTAAYELVGATSLELPLVIDGVEIFEAERERGGDPSRGGATWYEHAVASSDHVDAAVAAAAGAQREWSSRPALERRAILEQCAAEMVAHASTTMAVMARDAGKTFAEAEPEVCEAIDFARYYARAAEHLDGSDPLGVVVVAPPWNFPYAIVAGGVCAALAAGNAVVLKPATETVATAFELAQHLWGSGVPRHVLQFVATRDDETGRHLISHAGVDAVVLTGAFETAQLFTSWREDLTLLAETSGKNAILVSACADVDNAVRDLVHSAYSHAGQKCSAASVAIVERSVLRDSSFLRQLRDCVQSLRVGGGADLASVVGPVVRAPDEKLRRALLQLDDGESWLVEPEALDPEGLLWRPGVKVGVAPRSWSHRTEWFGPVLAVIEAPDFDTGMAWQSETEYGLTAGLQSLDADECERWIDTVQAGNLYVNRGITGAVVNRQPFGGWKRSSVGPTAKAGGPHYVASLRRWPEVYDADATCEQVSRWWREMGSASIDWSGLEVERNYRRYRRLARPILVRCDESTSRAAVRVVGHLSDEMGVDVLYSDARRESLDAALGRAALVDRVRWLSAEAAPTSAFLERGVSVDTRSVAQRGDVEAPRWLNEQSVSVTVHRYGNTAAGPKPRCVGYAGTSIIASVDDWALQFPHA